FFSGAVALITVGLIADPGLPRLVATAIAAQLAAQLCDAPDAGQAVEQWDIDVKPETLPLIEDGTVPLMRRAGRLREREEWDYVIYLADLPRSRGDELMLCEVSASARAAFISMPAVGALRLKSRTRELLLRLIKAMRSGDEFSSDEQLIGRRVLCRQASEGDKWHLVIPGPWNQVRLLAGMVRSNRPGRLFPALTNATAVSIATGAFGVFYASL